MRLSFLTNPWAASAAHIAEVAGPAALQLELRRLPSGARFAVALWLDEANDWRRRPGEPAKPYVVLADHGCPLRTQDGFLAVRGGNQTREYAETAWQQIVKQPAREREQAKFFGVTLADFNRQAVYGGPRGVIEGGRADDTT